jgi:hypothetical protein
MAAMICKVDAQPVMARLAVHPNGIRTRDEAGEDDCGGAEHWKITKLKLKSTR